MLEPYLSNLKTQPTMKYKITKHDKDINITVSDLKGNEDQIVDAFQECKEGRCSCPTQEYDKVASFTITDSEESVQLSIKTKNGETIDADEIERCLLHAKKQIAKD